MSILIDIVISAASLLTSGATLFKLKKIENKKEKRGDSRGDQRVHLASLAAHLSSKGYRVDIGDTSIQVYEQGGCYTVFDMRLDQLDVATLLAELNLPDLNELKRQRQEAADRIEKEVADFAMQEAAAKNAVRRALRARQAGESNADWLARVAAYDAAEDNRVSHEAKSS